MLRFNTTRPIAGTYQRMLRSSPSTAAGPCQRRPVISVDLGLDFRQSALRSMRYARTRPIPSLIVSRATTRLLPFSS
jgi:hypothetical protein